ncbi:MAG: hypothetical protein ACRD0U_18020 [Acidimicrobiales bacterium]
MPRAPDFADVLAAAAHFQELFADAILVGGTAAAQHAGHRVSFDADHVIADLRDRFDELLDALEATDGWATARVRRPVLILGRLDGIETGIRQLIRRRPLEVEEVKVDGRALRIPTLEEMARVKAWLVLRRNAVRDYLDLVALAARLGDRAAATVGALDEYYADQHGPPGRRVATQLAKQLAEPRPYDLDDVDLARYRKLVPEWRSWSAVEAACRDLGTAMLERLSEEDA